jgi:hypothetical protein
MHASKDERRVIIDVPLHSYLYRYRKFAGIMVVRPQEVARSNMAALIEKTHHSQKRPGRLTGSIS